MERRGKVLRDAHLGPGLLMVDGRQYPFVLEGLWKSDVPAKPGLAVDVAFDPEGNISAIVAVPESQLAREQAELALAAAKKGGAALAARMAATFGVRNLAAAGLLMVSWLFLTSASIRTPLGSWDFTFWQLLGYLNVGNSFELLMEGGRHSPGTGLYGLLAWLAIAGPFIHHVWNDRRAVLGGLLPLFFLLGAGIAIRSAFRSSFGPAGTGSDFAVLMEQARDEAMRGVSLGFGAYLSLFVSLYFAGVSLKRFFVATAGKYEQETQSRQAAA